MQAEVAVISNLSFLIDETCIVRASDDAVLAADALVSVHRHNTGLGIAMSSTRRANRHTRCILTLLAGNTDVAAVGGVTATFDLAVFQFEQQTRHTLREVIRLVTSDSAVATAYALVLVKDHPIVRLTGFTLLSSTASTEGHEDERASTGTSEKFSPVDLFAHNVLHEQTSRG